jgi:bacterial/archaeal transporter family-2 protein
MSVFIVFAITVGPPRIGVAATIGVVIAGNLVSAAVIDRYGLLGQEVIPIDRWRLLGLLLLAAGAALSLSRT